MPSELGILLVSLLVSRYRYCMLDIAPSDDGIEPTSELVPKFIYCNNDKLLRDDGIVPPKLLSPRSRRVNEVNPARDEVMVPDIDCDFRDMETTKLLLLLHEMPVQEELHTELAPAQDHFRLLVATLVAAIKLHRIVLCKGTKYGNM